MKSQRKLLFLFLTKPIRQAFHVCISAGVSASGKVVLVHLSVSISMMRFCERVIYPRAETLLNERLFHARVDHTDATCMHTTLNL